MFALWNCQTEYHSNRSNHNTAQPTTSTTKCISSMKHPSSSSLSPSPSPPTSPISSTSSSTTSSTSSSTSSSTTSSTTSSSTSSTSSTPNCPSSHEEDRCTREKQNDVVAVQQKRHHVTSFSDDEGVGNTNTKAAVGTGIKKTPKSALRTTSMQSSSRNNHRRSVSFLLPSSHKIAKTTPTPAKPPAKTPTPTLIRSTQPQASPSSLSAAMGAMELNLNSNEIRSAVTRMSFNMGKTSSDARSVPEPHTLGTLSMKGASTRSCAPPPPPSSPRSVSSSLSSMYGLRPSKTVKLALEKSLHPKISSPTPTKTPTITPNHDQLNQKQQRKKLCNPSSHVVSRHCICSSDDAGSNDNDSKNRKALLNEVKVDDRTLPARLNNEQKTGEKQEKGQGQKQDWIPEKQRHLQIENEKSSLVAAKTEIQLPVVAEHKKGLSLLANNESTTKPKEDNIRVKVKELSPNKNEHKHGNGLSNRRTSITCTSVSATHHHRKSESPRSPPLAATLNLTDMKSSNGRTGFGVDTNGHGRRHGPTTIGGTFLADGLFLPAESSLHAYTYYPYMDTYGSVNGNVFDNGMPLYNNTYSFGDSGLYHDASATATAPMGAATGPLPMAYPTGTTDWNWNYCHGQAHVQTQSYNEAAGYATNSTHCSSINNNHYDDTGNVNMNAWLGGQTQAVQHGNAHECAQPHASADVAVPGVGTSERPDMTVPQYNQDHTHEALPHVIEQGQERHFNGQDMNSFMYDGDVNIGMNQSWS